MHKSVVGNSHLEVRRRVMELEVEVCMGKEVRPLVVN